MSEGNDGAMGATGPQGPRGKQGVRGATGPGPSADQFSDLIDAIQTQSDEVIKLRRQTTQQSTALSQSKKLVRLAIRGLIVAIIIGLSGLYYAWHANDLINLANEKSVERSIASCNNQNDFYSKHNKLVDEDEATLTLIFSNAQSEQAHEFLAKRIEAYETNKVALRDCSVSGVKKYLTTSTTNP